MEGPEAAAQLPTSTGEGESWQSFKPMYFLATYKDTATKTPHVIVLIVAPSGVCPEDASKVRVWLEEDGRVMDFMSQWPQPAMDMDPLHEKIASRLGEFAADTDLRDVWKRSEALSDVLALMRGSEEEVLTSTCRIPLPFQVSRRIHSLQLHGNSDGMRIIYVDMKAEDSTYKAMEMAKVDFMDETKPIYDAGKGQA
jgi:hypothetical protein